MNWELPDVQAGFRKGREVPEIKSPTSTGSQKKRENSRKISVSLTELKPLTVWITRNSEKKTLTTLPVSWETCMQIKKQQLELDMEMDWFKIGKGVCHGCILLLCHLTYTQTVCGVCERERERESLSLVWLFVIPWTVAHQALLPMEFSRQEYWSE